MAFNPLFQRPISWKSVRPTIRPSADDLFLPRRIPFGNCVKPRETLNLRLIFTVYVRLGEGGAGPDHPSACANHGGYFYFLILACLSLFTPKLLGPKGL